MNNHPLGELMESTMTKIREMIDVNTVVGSPISTADGLTLIPVSKVSFGFASGGSDFQTKNSGAHSNFGGGSGAGVNITPVAFIVIRDSHARVMTIDPPASGAVEKLINMAPDLVDKVTDAIHKNKVEKID